MRRMLLLATLLICCGASVHAQGQNFPSGGGGGTPGGNSNDIQCNKSSAFAPCGSASGAFTSNGSLITHSETGVFNNSQMNTYTVSKLNSCSPATEYSIIQLGNYSTDAVDGCITDPGSSTVHSFLGTAGYVSVDTNGAGGTVADGVGAYGQCRSFIAGGACWGVNGGASDGYPNTAYASRLEGGEFDCWIGNSGSTCWGVQVTGTFTAQPGQSLTGYGAAPAFLVSGVNGGVGAVQTSGLACAEGATDNGSTDGDCVDIAPTNSSVSNNHSQSIVFHALNSTSTVESMYLLETISPDGTHPILGAGMGPGGTTSAFSPNSLVTGGYAATLSGCSYSSADSGAIAGKFVSGTSGTCTITLTFPVQSYAGWSCGGTMSDITTAADSLKQTGYTATTAVYSGTTVSGDTIVYGTCAGF